MANWLSLTLGAGAILGGVGYALGQFISARRKGVADSLATALDEIRIARDRIARLEAEMHHQAEETAALRAENAILRGLVSGAAPILEAIEKARTEMEELIRAEHEKTRVLIETIMGGEGAR